MQKLFFLGLSLFIFIADQLSKWAVTEWFLRPNAYEGQSMGLVEWYMNTPERMPYHEMAVLPFFNLVMVWNQGVSFGMFTQSSQTGTMILLALTILITGIFIAWLAYSRSALQQCAIALIIGGALGNVVDRVRFGAVIDFLDFHAFGWHYPAFNIADSAIVVGIIILIIYSLFFEKTVQE